MTVNQGRKKQLPGLLQFLVLFVVPLIILTRFSGEDQLGPVRAFLIALAFPLAYEAYGATRRKKVSLLSVVAVGGILITGAISLLGLSEEWLAIRRAAPYLAAGLVLLTSILINRPLIDWLMPYILDMNKVHSRLKKNGTTAELRKYLTRSGHMFSALLIILAIVSYVLTKIIILSSTDTPEFNQEYARLRLMSIPFTTLPLIIGVTGILYYLVTALERLTGLEFDQILKKK